MFKLISRCNCEHCICKSGQVQSSLIKSFLVTHVVGIPDWLKHSSSLRNKPLKSRSYLHSFNRGNCVVRIRLFQNLTEFCFSSKTFFNQKKTQTIVTTMTLHISMTVGTLGL